MTGSIQRIPPAPVTLLAADAPEAIAAEIAALDNAALRRELASAIQLVANNLLRLAYIVRTLEERGEDLADLNIGLLLNSLRQIAYGQLLPEVILRFGRSPALVQMIAALPIPDQSRLASGIPVALVVKEGEEYTHRLADPLKMTMKQVRQVFGPDGLRDESEQILRLQGQSAIAVARPKPRSFGKASLDPKRRGIRVGKTLIATATIVDLLAELASQGGQAEADDEKTDETQQVACKLTEREAYSLRRAALDGGVSVAHLLRRTLRAAGLLAGPGPEE